MSCIKPGKKLNKFGHFFRAKLCKSKQSQVLFALQRHIFADRECPELPQPEAGKVTMSGRQFGGTATYSCPDGQKVVGVSRRNRMHARSMESQSGRRMTMGLCIEAYNKNFLRSDAKTISAYSSRQGCAEMAIGRERHRSARIKVSFPSKKIEISSKWWFCVIIVRFSTNSSFLPDASRYWARSAFSPTRAGHLRARLHRSVSLPHGLRHGRISSC